MPSTTRTPKAATSTRIGTASQTLTRSTRNEEEKKPRKPPASRTRSGCEPRGTPWAMWIRPRMPSRTVTQPIACRPPGPLRSGWRRVRQAIQAAITGTA